jgi:glycosyltransferase 2 family protein
VAESRGLPWRRVAGLLFAAAAFAFLTLLVLRNLEELRDHEWSVRPGLLALSLLLNMAGLAWGVRVWQLVLRGLATPTAYLPLARVWFVSGLGRYIPGKIWQFVGAAHLGGRLGIPPPVAVTSLAVHTGFFLIGALLVAIYLVPDPVGDLGGVTIEVVRWAGPLLLLLCHPVVVGAGLRVVRRLTPTSGMAWTGSWSGGVGMVLLSAIGWGISGLAFFVFVRSLTPLPSWAVGGIAGINALGFVAGYLVFIAPAGLGAKETALTALLAVYVPAPVAALLAVSARLWTIAAELIPALILLRGNDRAARDALDRHPPDAAESP